MGGSSLRGPRSTRRIERHHLAVEELEHECVVHRHSGDERRAHAGLRRTTRVVRLVLAVDGEQAGVLAGDADDVAASRRRHLVVRVRQPARERLDLGCAVQFRDGRQYVFKRHGAILLLD